MENEDARPQISNGSQQGAETPIRFILITWGLLLLPLFSPGAIKCISSVALPFAIVLAASKNTIAKVNGIIMLVLLTALCGLFSWMTVGFLFLWETH